MLSMQSVHFTQTSEGWANTFCILQPNQVSLLCYLLVINMLQKTKLFKINHTRLLPKMQS